MEDFNKILVVDDQHHNVLVLKNKLMKEGYNVLEATSGLEAIDLTFKESPNLILLDIMMPSISGYDVCKRLHEDEKTRNIPIILVTALTKDGDVELGYQNGAMDYIKKPFNFTELLIKVRTALKIGELESLQSALDKIKIHRDEYFNFQSEFNNDCTIINKKFEKLKSEIKDDTNFQLLESFSGDLTEITNKLRNKISILNEYYSHFDSNNQTIN